MSQKEKKREEKMRKNTEKAAVSRPSSTSSTPELPRGFTASGFAGGVKGPVTGPVKNPVKGDAKKERLDMALIFSETPAAAAGVFTKNSVRADCVEWNRSRIERGGSFRAICTNSGNANACTGARGAEDSKTLASSVSRLLSVNEEEVLLASTGVIGVPLPIERMAAALEKQEHAPHPEGLEDAARAIMTTDTVPKVAGRGFRLGGQEVRITGIAKGSGMIHPNMATMLGFVITDAAVKPEILQEAVRRCADRTFNMISVDGDTSTNDMLLLMANGASGTAAIDSLETPEGRLFYEKLFEVTRDLAVMIARDGEGATKLIDVQVRGAADEAAARSLARAVTSSSLVKAAFFGEDANWGRILAAMGATDVDFDREGVYIGFRSSGGEVTLMEHGSPAAFDENLAFAVLSQNEIVVDICLTDGDGSARGWGCDLSYDYVKINGDYRT